MNFICIKKHSFGNITIVLKMKGAIHMQEQLTQMELQSLRELISAHDLGAKNYKIMRIKQLTLK